MPIEPVSAIAIGSGVLKTIAGVFEGARARRMRRKAGEGFTNVAAQQGKLADTIRDTGREVDQLATSSRMRQLAGTEAGINTAAGNTAAAAREIGGLSPAARLAQLSIANQSNAMQRVGAQVGAARQAVQDRANLGQFQERENAVRVQQAQTMLNKSMFDIGEARAAAADADALIGAGMRTVEGNLSQISRDRQMSRAAEQNREFLTGLAALGVGGGLGFSTNAQGGMAQQPVTPALVEPGELLVREQDLEALMAAPPSEFLKTLQQVAEPVGGRGMGDSQPNALAGRDIVLSNADLARMQREPNRAAEIFSELYDKYDSERVMSRMRALGQQAPTTPGQNQLLATVVEAIRQAGMEPTAEDMQQLAGMDEQDLMDVLDTLEGGGPGATEAMQVVPEQTQATEASSLMGLAGGGMAYRAQGGMAYREDGGMGGDPPPAATPRPLTPEQRRDNLAAAAPRTAYGAAAAVNEMEAENLLLRQERARLAQEARDRVNQQRQALADEVRAGVERATPLLAQNDAQRFRTAQSVADANDAGVSPAGLALLRLNQQQADGARSTPAYQRQAAIERGSYQALDQALGSFGRDVLAQSGSGPQRGPRVATVGIVDTRNPLANREYAASLDANTPEGLKALAGLQRENDASARRAQANSAYNRILRSQSVLR